MNGPLVGCIADDYTGATDLAGLLGRSGMRVVQCFGVPPDQRPVDACDAIVVALKTRSIAAEAACRQSCQVARWLQSIGTQRFFFKYCSTFDSTPQGNIGPVAEALMDLLRVRQTIFCPAFPENGRTVYRGHLFVGDRLLSESGMQDHPLNPMTDSNLVRFLSRQTHQDVGLLSIRDMVQGATSIRHRLDQLPPLVIADAIDDSHLELIAEIAVDQKLVTGGSAIAGCIARRLAGQADPSIATAEQRPSFVTGPAAILSGSCSLATQEQVAIFSEGHRCLHLDIAKAAEGDAELVKAKAWVRENCSHSPLLICTTTDAESLERIQRAVGREKAAQRAEYLLSELGAYLVELGVKRLIVAGGETAGAVIGRLGIQAIRIGPEIAPGVPWTESVGQPRIALALKSGNFGSKHFFREALEFLDEL